MKITAKIQRRTWYVDGVYFGNKSPWVDDVAGETAKELTGDFYGDWQGRRHFDGAEIIGDFVRREIENRELLAKNHPDNEFYKTGEIVGFPCRLQDYGEYRVVTLAD